MPILVIARLRSFRRFMGEGGAHRKPNACGTIGGDAAFSGGKQFEERHMADHEKEVIVTDGGGGGGGGAIIAVVLLVVVLVVLFLIFGTNFMRSGNPTDINADIKVETPKTN